MSDEQKDILRVSLDELQNVAEPQRPMVAANAEGAKAYGSIHEPSEPEALTQEKGSFFLKGWVYLGLAGMIGATLGWAMLEPWFMDGPNPHGRPWVNVILIPVLATLMCIGFAIAESLVERSMRKALIRIAIALPLGLVLSFVFDQIANIIFQIGVGILSSTTAVSERSPIFWIVRAIAWAAFGAAGGVIYGIVGRSGKKVGYGALGGVIGSFLGGILFDPIAIVTHGGVASRGVGFALLGLATGVAMGLVESALKDRWLYVTSGPLAGKQFILYKPQTEMGSSQSCDIYLFKDQEILPRHAVLVQKGPHIHILAEGPVYLAGQPVRGSRMLENGSIVQVGRYKFRYQEKARG